MLFPGYWTHLEAQINLHFSWRSSFSVHVISLSAFVLIPGTWPSITLLVLVVPLASSVPIATALSAMSAISVPVSVPSITVPISRASRPKTILQYHPHIKLQLNELQSLQSKKAATNIFLFWSNAHTNDDCRFAVDDVCLQLIPTSQPVRSSNLPLRATNNYCISS